ncbi:MAG: DUF3795 domain-containing protein [Candidatus Lokiarchaeota archaeon]|nr:DUF3795 domain-containing protein [Candidatus Lokiarchaeota archaeon]
MGNLIFFRIFIFSRMQKDEQKRDNGENQKTKDLDLIGYCGNNCSKCKIYQITVTNDEKEKKKFIEEAEFFSNKKINPDEIYCLGCRNPHSKRRNYLDIECQVRTCAMEKEVFTCYHCPLFCCTKLDIFLQEFSTSPAKSARKIKKKLSKLENNEESIQRWLKKQKKV